MINDQNDVLEYLGTPNQAKSSSVLSIKVRHLALDCVIYTNPYKQCKYTLSI